MERRAAASLALDPDPAVHQLRQALANRQPETSPAVVARCRGIHLLERFEEPILPLNRNSDAGITHGKVQQPLLRRAAVERGGVAIVRTGSQPRLRSLGGECFARRPDFDHDLSLMSEFNGVADKVYEYLPQACHITDQNL